MNSIKVSDCGSKMIKNRTQQGNGLIEFKQKMFCSKEVQGQCTNIAVCEIGDLEEEKFYVPLNRTLNKSKETVFKELKSQVYSISTLKNSSSVLQTCEGKMWRPWSVWRRNNL